MNNKIKERFLEISRIPRLSGKEEKIVEYLESFAKKHNLKYIKDTNRNIVIYKKGNRKGNINIQCHTDMVCEKAKGSKHNFEEDPICVLEKDGYLFAKDTTLGADNGAGIAIILELLSNKNINHPDIACIFTSEEETTMQGAKSIPKNFFLGTRVLSLDSMTENVLVHGSASAKVYDANKKVTRVYLKNMCRIRVNILGFLGGHSGEDIAKGRKNAAKILAEILKNTLGDIYVEKIKVGEKANVIPLSAFAILVCKEEECEKIQNHIYSIVNKYSNLEENIYAEIVVEKVKEVLATPAKEIVNEILELPCGSIIVENCNPKLSANIGRVVLDEDKFCIAISTRSNILEKEEELEKQIYKILNTFVIDMKNIKGYCKNNSYFLEVCKKVYKKVYKKSPQEEEKHICLECGIFNEKIKDLEYVAISPNIYNAHSTEEKVEIASMYRIYKYVIELLENI